MQFEKISAKSQSQTCIDLRNFPLPFFSMSAIDKYYIERKEKAIVKELKNEQKQIIELYESSDIDKQDAIEKLTELVLKYREYKFGVLKTRTRYNRFNTHFEDLRKKIAELEGKPFLRSVF
jgi:hypothetical protein